MSSSAHSALASLTATYTDSEDETEIDEHDSNSNVQIIERPSAPNSPQQRDSSSRDSQSSIKSNSHVSSGGGDSLKSGGGGESQKSSKEKGGGNNALGLVSYQDDLIDDEAVDDHYTSDSNAAIELEETPEDENSTILETGANGDVANSEKMETDNEVLTNNSGKTSRIPPEPPGKCSAELQEKITKLYEKKLKGGLDMNLAIQRNKNFRNPSIYEKLIKYCDIDELGSNYPRDVFDPHEWHESSYYDELAKAQKAEMERRERERKERTKVDFVSGTVKKPPVPLISQGGDEPKRKSKWDQRGVMPPLLMTLPAPAIQPQVVQPPFTNSASGTKSTVISAFGSIKKPKI